MQRITLDLLPEEILIIKLAMVEFIEQQRKIPEQASKDWADQMRKRHDIAMRVRGKLPTIDIRVADEL